MIEKSGAPGRRAAAIAVLRDLRRLDDAIGIRHSGIARDVALLLFEAGEDGMSVNQISSRTGYSGPTVRLVLDRLTEASAIAAAQRIGKTQLYRLTPRGMAGCDAYVDALFAFAEAQATRQPEGPPPRVLSRAAPGPGPDRPEGRLRPPAPHAAAPRLPEAAD
ncbi:hypothetical protein [Falsiroseomonas sp. HW251]|uniref:hypothetical protein n=1 Tax=Falsiroseomonas sp. HW251 TaxID=3390998 RepID=UPI003D31F688